MDGLKPSDILKVKIGNALALYSFKIMQLCYSLGIAACMENPAASRIWNLPQARRFMSKIYVKSVNLDFCMFGTPWRKRTKLVYCWVDLRHLGRLCSRHKGKCDRTGTCHQIWEGKKTGTSIFWTSIAEPYPRRLVTLWARCCKNNLAVRAFINLSSLIHDSRSIGSG